MNTNYNNFLLNTMLHHVDMSWIIEKNQELNSFIDKHNPDWITSGPWYNTSVCKKNTWNIFLKIILEIQELKDMNLYGLLVHMRNISHKLLIMVSMVVVIYYHKMRQ